jgi:hypothetical protein
MKGKSARSDRGLQRVPLSGIGEADGIGERCGQRRISEDRAADGLARHDLIPDFLFQSDYRNRSFGANSLQP